MVFFARCPLSSANADAAAGQVLDAEPEREPVESLEALAATLEGYKLENLPAWKNVQVDAGQQAWTQPLPTRAVWDVD